MGDEPEISKCQNTGIDELSLHNLRKLSDQRGFLTRSIEVTWPVLSAVDFSATQQVGIRSHRGALRGFHLRFPFDEWKLVRVVSGVAFDAVVDLRSESPSYGKVFTCTLSGDAPQVLLIPPGCAHAIQATSDELNFTLTMNVSYDSKKDIGFRWDDDEVAIAWPIIPPVLSDRDASAPNLSEIKTLILSRMGD